jgi:hypothetical protein
MDCVVWCGCGVGACGGVGGGGDDGGGGGGLSRCVQLTFMLGSFLLVWKVDIGCWQRKSNIVIFGRYDSNFGISVA